MPSPDMSDPKAQGIDYFNRGHWLTPIQNRLSLAARRRMFERFREFAGPLDGLRLLDVGATPDQERSDSNCMLPWFREAGLSVTLYSPEDLSGLAPVFPWAAILPSRGFGAPIPVAPRSHDWVCASAVIEHVGPAAQQVAFIRECAQAGNGLFLTTPNRFHWLEFHTKLPLLHWLPRPLHRAALRALGHTTWAEERHLRLLGPGELRSLAVEAMGREFEIAVRRVWALGMPSNLVLLARRLPTRPR